MSKCLELHAFTRLEWTRASHAVKSLSSVLFRQNQLLAKGLLFVEEKIKLCEGKYKAAPVWREL